MTTEEIKKYRREFYKKRYNTNEEYKEYKKTYNKARYIRKCNKCIDCGCRIKIMENVEKCLTCKLAEAPQIKCIRGRKKKNTEVKPVEQKQEDAEEAVEPIQEKEEEVVEHKYCKECNRPF